MESWSVFREGRVETITTSRGLGAVILTNQGLYVCEGTIKAHAEKHTPICAHTNAHICPYKSMPIQYMPIQVYVLQYMPIHVYAHMRPYTDTHKCYNLHTEVVQQIVLQDKNGLTDKSL